MITSRRVDERMAQVAALTLGDVETTLEGVLPAELAGGLRKAVEARNFLAHQFWFERAHPMFNGASVQALTVELDGYTQQFLRRDTLISDWKKPKLRELGLTDELIEDSQRRILAGEPGEPLPGRDTVRELGRKLSKPQRLVHVWHITKAQGSTSLIFELVDASLWQLSDVGLGWTRFQKVDPSWTEHPATKPHLPANILPRPKVHAPWDYEFTLANGAMLWVKPGLREHTFRWGVRTPEAGCPALGF